MSVADLLTQYRLRRLAMQFREFTVHDLETTAEVSSQVVHNFLHELAKLHPDQIEKRSIGTDRPGRPRLRYLLKPKALQFLAEMNLEIAQELNAEAFRQDPLLRSKSSGKSAPKELASADLKSKVEPIAVSVINASTVLTDSEIEPVIGALQKQVTNDFRPAWGIDAELSFVPRGEQPPEDTWWLTILDDSDQAGALGYYDLTTAGLPLGKVFAGTDLKYGYTWSVTASHELLEMLADPNINLTVLVQSSDTAGRLYASEVCDACEADENGYEIDGVLLSDFVFPSWFEDFRAKGSTQFDQIEKIEAPFDLLPGGYIGVFDVNSGIGWHQVTNEKRPTNVLLRGNVGSRRERRRVPRGQWLPTLSHRQITSRAEQYLRRVSDSQNQSVAAGRRSRSA